MQTNGRTFDEQVMALKLNLLLKSMQRVEESRADFFGAIGWIVVLAVGALSFTAMKDDHLSVQTGSILLFAVSGMFLLRAGTRLVFIKRDRAQLDERLSEFSPEERKELLTKLTTPDANGPWSVPLKATLVASVIGIGLGMVGFSKAVVGFVLN